MVMQNFDESVSDHPFMILIIGCLRLVKANALLNKGYWQKDIGKSLFTLKIDTNENINHSSTKKQRLSKHFKLPRIFIECSQTINDVYKNLEVIIEQDIIEQENI